MYGVGDSSELILYDQAKKKYYASYTLDGADRYALRLRSAVCMNN